MTFHDRRLVATTRNVTKFRRRRLIEQGARSINLWSTMPPMEFGEVADDWRAVGADMRKAFAQYVEERG